MKLSLEEATRRQTGPIQTDHNSPERIRVIVRPGKDDWIGVAYSSSAEPNDIIREYISPLGYEHAITVGWNEHNARRHELIEAKRSRVLSESESAELVELQWLAGIKRELQTGPAAANDFNVGVYIDQD